MRAKFIFLFLLASVVASAEPTSRWTQFREYQPEKIDYGLEVGSMWEKNSLYWLGGNIGFRMSSCWLVESNCYQYADVIGGVGGREGLTTGLLLGGWRWQWVNSKSVSPSVRILLGAMNILDDDRDAEYLAYGLGLGATVSLLPGLDVRGELRGGAGDRPWGQAMVTFSVKIQESIDHFAGRLKGLGEGAADATGKVIRGTLQAPANMIKMVSEEEEASDQNKKPGSAGESSNPNEKK